MCSGQTREKGSVLSHRTGWGARMELGKHGVEDALPGDAERSSLLPPSCRLLDPASITADAQFSG